MVPSKLSSSTPSLSSNLRMETDMQTEDYLPLNLTNKIVETNQPCPGSSRI